MLGPSGRAARGPAVCTSRCGITSLLPISRWTPRFSQSDCETFGTPVVPSVHAWQPRSWWRMIRTGPFSCVLAGAAKASAAAAAPKAAMVRFMRGLLSVDAHDRRVAAPLDPPKRRAAIRSCPQAAIDTLERVPHGHHTSDAPVSLTRNAVQATLHCLTGCAIGEVLGMVIATALGLDNAPSIALSVVLAFFFGYALTIGPVPRAGVPRPRALRLAFASDTASIAVMELVDNAFLLVVPGALAAGLTDSLFWWSLALSLVIAFVVTLPVNRALIARGRGHAVIHELHAH